MSNANYVYVTDGENHTVQVFLERGLMQPGKHVPHGQLSPRQLARLTRGMGVTRELKSDLYTRQVVEDDVYLTCSDGLHGYCEEREILKTLLDGPLSHAPGRLVQLAHSAGAPDNVTVVISVVSSHDEPLQEPTSKTLFTSQPFLLRTSDHQLLGPLNSEAIVDLLSLIHI